MQAETRYARLGSARIAYQVMGEGPPDLVLTSGSFSQLDVIWEDPTASLFLRRLASFSRLIRFDRRGTSASDPLPFGALPPWESYAEDLVAVMDAVDSERIAVVGSLDAGPMALLFAATKPERVESLVLINTTAKYAAAEGYDVGLSPEAVDAFVERVDQIWGTEELAALQVPSRAHDPVFRRWYAKNLRAMAGPAAVRTFLRALAEVDARPVLSSISVPTLVMHRVGYAFLGPEHGRYLAEHIPGATFQELPGADGSLIWEHPDEILDRIQEFVTGAPRLAESNRQLATVLFTDVVGSTELARTLGDRRWRELLDVHDDVVARTVGAHQGRLVKSTGDGALAIFDGPGRAIRAALGLREQLRLLGLSIRVGLHAGEVEVRGDDVGGLTVNIAGRVMSEAAPDEVLISRTVRDLVVGSDFHMADRGVHRLRGLDVEWQLFAVG